jgi:predicted DNA-binding protein with PD1-like motif
VNIYVQHPAIIQEIIPRLYARHTANLMVYGFCFFTEGAFTSANVMNFLLIYPALMLMVATLSQVDSSSAQPRYAKVTHGYVMVLRQGDDVIIELEKFALAEDIPSANFTGMGFVNITFGFFDKQTKTYKPKDYKDVELASMHGTIGYKNEKPSIHAHGVAGDNTFQTFGGHILKATVSTGSVEIFITSHDKRFVRKRDESLGADVLQLE